MVSGSPGVRNIVANDRRVKDLLLQAGSTATSLRPVRGVLARTIAGGRLPRSIWSRIPVDTAFRVDVSDDEHFQYEAKATDVLGRFLFWRGLAGWEPETTSVFVALARSARGVVDAGAHTGLYSLLACAVNSDLRVWAFEPVPRIADVLRSNLERNGWLDRCTVFENPVAETDGYVPFHVPASSTPMSASLDPEGLRVGANDPAWQHSGGQVLTTYARAIDSCLVGDQPVDLVKIDVEGFEDRALAGLGKTLDRCAPAIVFEVLEALKFADIERDLKRRGYRFYKLTERGPEATDGLRPPVDPEFRNYLAVSRTTHEDAIEALAARD